MLIENCQESLQATQTIVSRDAWGTKEVNQPPLPPPVPQLLPPSHSDSSSANPASAYLSNREHPPEIGCGDNDNVVELGSASSGGEAEAGADSSTSPSDPSGISSYSCPGGGNSN